MWNNSIYRNEITLLITIVRAHFVESLNGLPKLGSWNGETNVGKDIRRFSVWDMESQQIHPEFTNMTLENPHFQ